MQNTLYQTTCQIIMIAENTMIAENKCQNTDQ